MKKWILIAYGLFMLFNSAILGAAIKANEKAIQYAWVYVAIGSIATIAIWAVEYLEKRDTTLINLKELEYQAKLEINNQAKDNQIKAQELEIKNLKEQQDNVKKGILALQELKQKEIPQEKAFEEIIETYFKIK